MKVDENLLFQMQWAKNTILGRKFRYKKYECFVTSLTLDNENLELSVTYSDIGFTNRLYEIPLNLFINNFEEI